MLVAEPKCPMTAGAAIVVLGESAHAHCRDKPRQPRSWARTRSCPRRKVLVARHLRTSSSSGPEIQETVQYRRSAPSGGKPFHPSRDRRVEAHRDPPAPFSLEVRAGELCTLLTVLAATLPGSVHTLVGVPVATRRIPPGLVPLGRLIASLSLALRGPGSRTSSPGLLSPREFLPPQRRSVPMEMSYSQPMRAPPPRRSQLWRVAPAGRAPGRPPPPDSVSDRRLPHQRANDHHCDAVREGEYQGSTESLGERASAIVQP